MSKERLHVYLSTARIAEIVAGMGKAINAEYTKLLGPGEELLVVVTLKGAMFFAADLLRQVTVPVNIDFVRLTSYGQGTKSSGVVRILKDVENSPEGKHVLVLDEIVDSGRTLSFLSSRIGSQGPKSLRVGALLSKPSRREVPVAVDFLGLEVDDKFLVGYGLDFGERFRNLADICYLEQ